MDINNIFTYHAPTPDQLPKYEAIRAKAKELGQVIVDNTPASADQPHRVPPNVRVVSTDTMFRFADDYLEDYLRVAAARPEVKAGAPTNNPNTVVTERRIVAAKVAENQFAVTYQNIPESVGSLATEIANEFCGGSEAVAEAIAARLADVLPAAAPDSSAGLEAGQIALSILGRDWPPIPKKGPNDAWIHWAFEVDQMTRTGIAALKLALAAGKQGKETGE